MQTPAPAHGLRAGKPGLLINRDFALLFGGQAVSNTGDYVFTTALVLWVAAQLARGRAWAPLAVGGVLLAEYVPIFLAGPLAGVYVDRWNKRRTMLRMDGLRTVLIALLVLVALAPRLPLVWRLVFVYGVGLGQSTAAQFFNPARFALIGDLVPGPYRAQALGLSQATFGLAVLIGPAIGAPLVLAVGVQWAIAFNAASFAVSYLAIRAIRAPSAASSVVAGVVGNIRRELMDGVWLLLRQRVLVVVLVCTVLADLGLGAIIALAYFFVTEDLHASAGLYGFLSTTFGGGAIAGALLSGLLARRIGVARLLWMAMLGMGAAMVVLAQMTSIGGALAVSAVFGAAFATVSVATGPLVLGAAPREYLGRVSAVLSPLGSLATMVAILGAGYLVSTILRGFHATLFGLALGPNTTCFTVAGLLALVGGLYALADLHGPDGAEPAPEGDAAAGSLVMGN